MGFADDNGAGTLAEDAEQVAKERAYLQQERYAQRGAMYGIGIAEPTPYDHEPISSLRQAALHAAILKYQGREDMPATSTIVDDAAQFAKFLKTPRQRPEALGDWKELTGHTVEGAAMSDLTVHVLDHKGPGGAHHEYMIHGGLVHTKISFQHGPIQEYGVNGVSHETLLCILIDRMEGFQSGEYANDYNAMALEYLRRALGELQAWTKQRLARGVEGTSAK